MLSLFLERHRQMAHDEGGQLRTIAWRHHEITETNVFWFERIST